MIGTVLSGRYRLEAKLGSGGMSTVYLARDTTLDRPVAVKVMHREMSEQADQLERFRQEARAVAKISHPNVVAVIDAGEDGGYPYIVFEYVEGETLKARINRVGALDVQESLAYAIEIARGLTVAHARKMVHRDIKPQNVLIDAEGRAKLTDFGISRQLEKEGMTATGRVLGVVLFEMLTGHVPFQADSQVGVAMKHVNEELPDVQADRPGLSAATALVVERATAKDPTKRYADIGEMIDDLSTALEVEAARAGSTTGEATTVLEAVPPAKRKLSRRATWSWVAILAAIGIAAAVLLATQLIGSGNVGNGGHPSNNGNGGGGGKTSEHPVAIEGATDYDPEGDGEEDPETVGLAVDGNPTGTAWSSEHYDTDTFAGTKEGPNPGVGLYVTTQAAVTPDKMKIITPTPGWDAQIYAAASGPPEEVEEWGEAVGEVKDAAKEEEVDLHLGQAAKYFLIWFTKASPASDQEGRFQVEIADVKLFE
jgi:serine/threonine-protein kinase